jgi:hypothetical protein
MGGDGPPRGGTRGGRDQFNWEDVKSDKDREFYLGASVKASVGRWQKGKDIFWYTRGKGGAEDSVAAELAAVKAEEERVRARVARRCAVCALLSCVARPKRPCLCVAFRVCRRRFCPQQLMQEALGLRPVTERRGAAATLDANELKELLKRGGGADGAAAADDEQAEATRVKGVGYNPLALAAEQTAGGGARETLAGVGVGGGAVVQSARGNAGALCACMRLCCLGALVHIGRVS